MRSDFKKCELPLNNSITNNSTINNSTTNSTINNNNTIINNNNTLIINNNTINNNNTLNNNNISSAICGDAITVLNVEECDDGNLDNNDGCDSNCKI